MTFNHLKTTLGVLLVMGMTACATAPQDSFYTLQPLPGIADFAQSPDQLSYTVVIDPVQVLPMVDRPQWVVRRNASEVRILEHQRWAYPLNEDIAQAVAAHITTWANTTPVLATSPLRVRAYAQTSGVIPSVLSKSTLHVQFNVLRFTTLLDPAPRIDDEFQWTVNCTTSSKGRMPDALQRAGSFRSKQEKLASVPNEETSYPALTAAHAKALQDVSKDIAAAIQELILQCPQT